MFRSEQRRILVRKCPLFIDKNRSQTSLFAVIAGIAQLVEHLICNQVVAGSSPIASFVRENIWRDTREAKGSRL